MIRFKLPAKKKKTVQEEEPLEIVTSSKSEIVTTSAAETSAASTAGAGASSGFSSTLNKGDYDQHGTQKGNTLAQAINGNSYKLEVTENENSDKYNPTSTDSSASLSSSTANTNSNSNSQIVSSTPVNKFSLPDILATLPPPPTEEDYSEVPVNQFVQRLKHLPTNRY
ncbi:hypothetical protein DASB73_013210 [Starmerella bacillaris]|uniref:Uncharacterized protein n=1 Tax=Starmerella bacillaris TaxID=1247836 RepID=A0AAV5RGW1_STABA|nr:hypothetical protein DASB73_013210 [Starmerella bacillaris]